MGGGGWSWLLGKRLSQRSFNLVSNETKIKIPHVEVPQFMISAPLLLSRPLPPIIIVVCLPCTEVSCAPLLVGAKRDRTPRDDVSREADPQVSCPKLNYYEILLRSEARR